MKNTRLILFCVAAAVTFAFSLMSGPVGIIAGIGMLTVVASLLANPQPRCMAATLSVPEILMDVLDAFKLELWPAKLMSTEMTSLTAKLGDKVTAHIATLPTTAAYHPTNGGFSNGAQQAESLIMDITAIVGSLRHVPVEVTWITQLASKLPLYREAIRNTGYALAKYVTDDLLSQASTNYFSNGTAIAPVNFNLDSLEAIRTALNNQKAYNTGRFGIINSSYAQYLQNDPRVQSSLFYGMLNGGQGFRVWKNLCGFSEIREYPDMPDNGQNVGGFFGDRRAIQLITRPLNQSDAAADAVGAPKIMSFTPMSDPETGLEMTGVTWQEAGTGNVFVSPAILYGKNAGKQALTWTQDGTYKTWAPASYGNAGDAADKAGYLLTSQ